MTEIEKLVHDLGHPGVPLELGVLLGCLVLAWLTASRLRALRRAGRSRGQHAADSRQPQPAWPGPRVPAAATQREDPQEAPRPAAPPQWPGPRP